MWTLPNIDDYITSSEALIVGNADTSRSWKQTSWIPNRSRRHVRTHLSVWCSRQTPASWISSVPVAMSCTVIPRCISSVDRFRMHHVRKCIKWGLLHRIITKKYSTCTMCQTCRILLVNITVSVPSVLTNEYRYLAKLNIEAAILGMHKVNMHTPFTFDYFYAGTNLVHWFCMHQVR